MLKKPGSNQQPNRGNSRKRGNSNVSRNGQNHNNVNESSNRNTRHGGKSHEPHLWASSASSSTILTSHLSMVNRLNQECRLTTKKMDEPETGLSNTPIRGTLIINLTQPIKNNHPAKHKPTLMPRHKGTKSDTMEFLNLKQIPLV